MKKEIETNGKLQNQLERTIELLSDIAGSLDQIADQLENVADAIKEFKR